MSSLRVAIADDEPDMRAFLTKLLKRFGHEVVVVAEDGLQLVNQSRISRPQLVITDLGMPGLDGFEALEVIRQEWDLWSIVVSAYNNDEYCERARDLNVMAYLVKPVGRAELEPVVRQAQQQILGSLS